MKTSLEARDNEFWLDGKPIKLLSGAMHYFRVVPEYWEHRMLSMKACGLNCVETYVAWNLHEEVRGEFRYDGMLDIVRFIKLAQKLGLYIILRPGPYICSEWDFGGLPSWLLTDESMRVRVANNAFLKAVGPYLDSLFKQVEDLQYCNGGPIIAVQLENEYGSYMDDEQYKFFLYESFRKCHVRELLFTSDNGTGIQNGNFQNELATANFQEKEHGELMFQYLRNLKQPGKPLMVMEFWCGWFNHWGETHAVINEQKFTSVLRWLLEQNSSVNFYMFHGGTNFGFMNGANEGVGATNEAGKKEPYAAVVTSYDYNSPISESGGLTQRYHDIRSILQELLPDYVKDLPEPPKPIPTRAYGDHQVSDHLQFSDLVAHVQPIDSEVPLCMESLPINNGGGQGYGFVLYETRVGSSDTLQLKGRVFDRATVYVNDDLVATVEPNEFNKSIPVKANDKLQILVENMGRVNYSEYNGNIMNEQRKGLCNPVLLGGKEVLGWKIFPLEFKPDYIKSLCLDGKWLSGANRKSQQPTLSRVMLELSDEPKDTFLCTKKWKKGVAFVNGFNLGRYWTVGPQQTLYLPAPLLRKGQNEILMFELHGTSDVVSFEAEAQHGGTHEHSTVIPAWASVLLYVLQKILNLGPWVWNILRYFLK